MADTNERPHTLHKEVNLADQTSQPPTLAPGDETVDNSQEVEKTMQLPGVKPGGAK